MSITDNEYEINHARHKTVQFVEEEKMNNNFASWLADEYPEFYNQAWEEYKIYLKSME